MFQALYELLHMNFIVITILVGRIIIRYYGIIFLIILQNQEVWRKKIKHLTIALTSLNSMWINLVQWKEKKKKARRRSILFIIISTTYWVLIICRFIAKRFDILFHLILPSALGVDVVSHHVTDAETEASLMKARGTPGICALFCHSWGSTPWVGKPRPFVQIWLASSLVNKMLLEDSHALSLMCCLCCFCATKAELSSYNRGHVVNT